MRPSGQLRDLHTSFQQRLARTRAKTVAAFAGKNSPAWWALDTALCYAVLEIHSSWTTFSRSYFLSEVRSAQTLSGGRITIAPAITDDRAALVAAITRCKGPRATPGPTQRIGHREEPHWFTPANLTNSSAAISASNYANMLAAFSTPSTVFRDLPTFRNFYAHRNFETAELATDLASRYSLPRPTHPTLLLNTPAAGRSQTILFDFMDELRITAELLCR